MVGVIGKQAGTLSNSLRVARQTKCRILLQMTANFLSRNYPTACRNPLRIGQPRLRWPGPRH